MRYRIPSVGCCVQERGGRPGRRSTGSRGAKIAHPVSARSWRADAGIVSTRSAVVMALLVDDPPVRDLASAIAATRHGNRIVTCTTRQQRLLKHAFGRRAPSDQKAMGLPGPLPTIMTPATAMISLPTTVPPDCRAARCSRRRGALARTTNSAVSSGFLIAGLTDRCNHVISAITSPTSMQYSTISSRVSTAPDRPSSAGGATQSSAAGGTAWTSSWRTACGRARMRSEIARSITVRDAAPGVAETLSGLCGWPHGRPRGLPSVPAVGPRTELRARCLQNVRSNFLADSYVIGFHSDVRGGISGPASTGSMEAVR